MDGVSLHLRGVALIRDEPRPGQRGLIFQGLAWHDGDVVELRDEAVDCARFVIPDDLVARAMPLTGRLAAWYPGAEYYIICGDRFDSEA